MEGEILIHDGCRRGLKLTSNAPDLPILGRFVDVLESLPEGLFDECHHAAGFLWRATMVLAERPLG